MSDYDFSYRLLRAQARNSFYDHEGKLGAYADLGGAASACSADPYGGGRATGARTGTTRAGSSAIYAPWVDPFAEVQTP